MKISNNRLIKHGDKVLFFTEDKSYVHANGFYFVESLDLNEKRVNAYPENGDPKDITSFNPNFLF